MTKRITLNSTIKVSPKSSASLDNPYVNTVSFVLTDDKPNANGVGIRREDFFSFAQSAVFMPIKMSEGAIGDHYQAKPIGAITQAEIDEDKIFGEGVLWPEERPADVALIKDKTSKGEAQISWEVSYDEDIVDDTRKTIWLGNPKLLAATLVKYPAYDGRTPITSFASNEEIMTEEVTEPTEEVVPEVPTEEIIKEVSPEEETKTELETLQEELETLRKYKNFTERSRVVIELLGDLPKRDLEELVELTDSQLKVVKRLVSSRKQEASVIPHIPSGEEQSPLSIFKLALEKHIGG
jgi:hypothetical protein